MMLFNAQGITVKFGGLTAVDDVHASFRSGELVGLIGPNGAGKTTLFNVLSGVQVPTAGKLVVGGESSSLELQGRAPHVFTERGIARSFQTPRVLPELTVAENVAFALRFAGKRRAGIGAAFSLGDILEMLGLAGIAAVPAASITPAQQRLLEIGMALGTRPDLLLLDEVAAGLTEAEVVSVAEKVRQVRDGWGISVIWIEHAVATLVRFVDRLIVLHQGRKLADGPVREVVSDPRVIEAYLGDEIQGAKA